LLSAVTNTSGGEDTTLVRTCRFCENKAISQNVLSLPSGGCKEICVSHNCVDFTTYTRELP